MLYGTAKDERNILLLTFKFFKNFAFFLVKYLITDHFPSSVLQQSSKCYNLKGLEENVTLWLLCSQLRRFQPLMKC